MSESGAWPELEIRHLVAFLAVCRHGTFGGAAAALGYTQSAVSHQIAALERITGERLLDRRPGRGRAMPTPAGELLRTHAEAVMTRLAEARSDLAALGAGQRGRIRVGAFQSVAAQLLPDLMHRLARDRPGLVVDLRESADEDDLLDAVDRDELDFAFTLLPVRRAGIAAEEVMNDPYVLVAGASSPHRIEIDSLAELADTPMVAPRRCHGTEAIAERMRAGGVQPRFAFRSDDDLTLRALVQAGLGVAFFADLTVRTLGDGLRTAAADHLVPARRIAIAWSQQRSLTGADQAFLAAARAAATEAVQLRAVAPAA